MESLNWKCRPPSLVLEHVIQGGAPSLERGSELVVTRVTVPGSADDKLTEVEREYVSPGNLNHEEGYCLVQLGLGAGFLVLLEYGFCIAI
jgi:hypothetical protein